MNMKRAFPCLTTGLLLAFSAGCNGLFPHLSGSSQYVTVPAHPARDEAKASRLNAQAMDLIAKKQYDQAEVLLKEALAADVMHGPAHNNLGLVYYFKDQLYLAAWEFEHASRLMPRHPEPRNNLGLVFEKVGKFEDAVDHYQSALRVEPDNPHLIGNLVRAKIRRGDKDEKVKELLTELVMKDDRPEWKKWAINQLGLMGREAEPAAEK